MDNKKMTNLAWLDELPEGWSDLYTTLIKQLEALNPEVEVEQAKQKFGELRVYISGGSAEAYKLIDAASIASRTACQVCGSEGQLRNDRGYYATLCDEHAGGSDPATTTPIVASFRIVDGKIYPVKR